MSTSLSALELQLASLKSSLAAPIVPVANETVTVSLEDLRSMVKDLISSELKEVRELAPEAKVLTLEEALCAILTGDEQTWLLNVDNIKRIPNFVVSDLGKPLAQEFIKQFRGYYGN
jgi:hypothetical protein